MCTHNKKLIFEGEPHPMDLEIDMRKVKKQSHSSTMAYDHRGRPIDKGERRFAMLESRVTNISMSMALLMDSLEKNID
jgi:hypothetical protein